MLARSDAMSSVSILKITSEFCREIVALPSSFGRRGRSGASADLIESAARFSFGDNLTLALQLFSVNVICPRRDLELALGTEPYAGRDPAKPQRAAGRAPTLFVKRAVNLTVAFAHRSTKLDPKALQGCRAFSFAASATNHSFQSTPLILPVLPLL